VSLTRLLVLLRASKWLWFLVFLDKNSHLSGFLWRFSTLLNLEFPFFIILSALGSASRAPVEICKQRKFFQLTSILETKTRKELSSNFNATTTEDQFEMIHLMLHEGPFFFLCYSVYEEKRVLLAKSS
jgi:hypothetical protein